MTGWREGLGPWLPVIEDGKLYGRGGADDGYAVFASLAAIGALQAQGTAARALRRLDRDLRGERQLRSARVPRALAPRMGRVDFVIGLDSGCGDYERLWATTSLRGLAGGTLTVDVLTEGVHSGDASGIVPSSFRIARKILDRLEDSATGPHSAGANSTCRFRRSVSGRRGKPRRSWATASSASTRSLAARGR